ncbi:MAG: hypothetical protein ACKV2V_20515 [Blastocatellia bacterium]
MTRISVHGIAVVSETARAGTTINAPVIFPGHAIVSLVPLLFDLCMALNSPCEDELLPNLVSQLTAWEYPLVEKSEIVAAEISPVISPTQVSLKLLLMDQKQGESMHHIIDLL